MGNMVSGLVGGALKAVGLEKLAPFVSLAVNAFTGNWVGVAMDVAGLAARIAPKSGFAQMLSTVAPIAGAFMGSGGSGGIGNLFKAGGLDNLISNFNNVTSSFKAISQGTDIFDTVSRVNNAFQTAKSFVDDLQSLNTLRSTAQQQLSLGNVFRQ